MFYESHIKKNTFISSTDIIHLRTVLFYISVYSGLPLRKAVAMQIRCLR